MGLIIDSSVAITAERQKLSVESLLAAIRGIVGSMEIAMSVVSVMELEHGIWRASESVFAVPAQPGTVVDSVMVGVCNMQKLSRSIHLGVLFAGGIASSWAQVIAGPGSPTAPAISGLQLGYNTEQMNVELRLDRTEYLAGEAAVITLSVSNPTPRALWVETPFSIRTGEVALLAHDGDRFGSPLLIQRADMPLVVSADLAVLLQPGERRERKFRTDDTQSDDDYFPPASGFSVPLQAGHYRFQYTYGRTASADFDVVATTVKAIVRRDVPNPETGDPATGSHAGTHRLQAAQLEAEGQRFLVVSLGRYEFPERGDEYTLKNVVPFVRLDTWKQRAPSVDLDRGADGILVAKWIGEDGTPKQLEIPPPTGCKCVVEVRE
jgi:hypothetical protein